jgi:CMP-N-acetylneuraminic acid synthetase
MVDVARHAVGWLQEHDGYEAEAVMLLQPTSPMRRSFHIDEAAQRFRESDTDAVVSVSHPLEHPYEFVSFSDGEMMRAVDRKVESSRRQDWPDVFFITGAIYLVRTSVLMRENTLLPRRSIPYLMDQRDSVDIDTMFDLKTAECLLAAMSEA